MSPERPRLDWRGGGEDSLYRAWLTLGERQFRKLQCHAALPPAAASGRCPRGFLASQSFSGPSHRANHFGGAFHALLGAAKSARSHCDSGPAYMPTRKSRSASGSLAAVASRRIWPVRFIRPSLSVPLVGCMLRAAASGGMLVLMSAVRGAADFPEQAVDRRPRGATVARGWLAFDLDRSAAVG